MVDVYMLGRVLEKIKIDTYNKLPDDITFKKVAILMTSY